MAFNQVISITLSGVNFLFILIAFAWIFRRIIINIRKHFISNKPSLFTLYYSAAASILIQMSLIWWTIKSWTYMDSMGENRELWFLFVLGLPLLANLGITPCIPCIFWYYGLTMLPCTEWFILCYYGCRYVWPTFDEDIRYQQRLYWMPFRETNGVLLHFFIYYAVPIISGGIYWGISYIDPDIIGEYGLKWYEYLSVVGLIFSKTILQLIYVHGRPYDEEMEDIIFNRLRVTNEWNSKWGMILRSKFGDNLGLLIFEYMFEIDHNLNENIVPESNMGISLCCKRTNTKDQYQMVNNP